MCKFRHIKQVTCNSSHYLSYFIVGIIGITKIFQMSKGISSHICFNIHTHNMSLRAHKEIRTGINNS